MSIAPEFVRREVPLSGRQNRDGSTRNPGIDPRPDSKLNESLSSTGMEAEPTVGKCAICGRLLTQVGSHGECLRCLADLGFLSGNQEPGQAETPRRLTPGPLKYDHFAVEIGADGFPIELGAGAMAITYHARDTILSSEVALKVIDRKVSKMPGVRTRFLREARAAAQIRHPNVARVTHYGEQDGECFYVMQLVEGETLEARVRREGPMSLALALEVIEQAARALAAAEKCGVVHRDIKPSNIMLESDPTGSLIVKVIDYGIAKVLDPEAERSAEQTRSGFIGTPAFASPEQFATTATTRIDTRSDIYSLGVTFWYLLSGRVPFVGRTLEDIRARQIEQLPLEQLKGLRVPTRCLALLKSMLSPDPKDRPQSARELLAAVHRCFIKFGTEARARRRRSALVAVGAILVIAATAVTAWLYQRAQPSSAMNRAIAVLPFENLSPNAEDQFFVVGVQDQILTRLASLSDLKVISRTSTAKYSSKPEDLNAVSRQLGVGRVLEGSVQRKGGKVRVNVQLIDARSNAHIWANTYDRPIADSFAVETEIANAVAQELSGNLSLRVSGQRPTQITAAYEAYLRGLELQEQDSSDASILAAGAAYTEAVRLDPNFALAWARLALVRSFCYGNGIDRNANSALSVKEAADRAMALQPDLGEAWIAQGQYKAAVLRDRLGPLKDYQQAEKLLPNSALVKEYLVYKECGLGRWRDALAHFRQATELDPRNYRLWTTTAVYILPALRLWSECHAAFDRALEISPDNEEAIACHADIFLAEGRLAEAARELARLPNESTSARTLNSRWVLAEYERNFDLALSWIRLATKDIDSGQPLGVTEANSLMMQAYCQKWTGRIDDARASFDRVVQGVAPTPGFVPARELRSILALAYAGLGEKEKALEQAQQGVADFANSATNKPIAEALLVKVQIQVGEVDAAITALPRLLETPCGPDPAELRYSPFFDPLRKDPRFQELLKNPPLIRY
ncbi:MAG TPA: protein kinase [Chthoniobacterales bacterium]|nr:protein kinase [Chthoniobacterales bacterium]